jgi:GT2 family glycosyltransferase
LKTELLSAISPLHPSLSRAADIARFGVGIDTRRTQEVPFILWGTALIVRKEILESVGLQDPRFFVYGEDVDWVMRIARAGWKLWLVAEAEVVHYGGQSTKQASTRMLAQIYKSKSRLIQKHYGTAAGITLRLAYAGVWGIRLTKWASLYILSSRSREEARERIQRMWAVIRAVLSY